MQVLYNWTHPSDIIWLSKKWTVWFNENIFFRLVTYYQMASGLWLSVLRLTVINIDICIDCRVECEKCESSVFCEGYMWVRRGYRLWLTHPNNKYKLWSHWKYKLANEQYYTFNLPFFYCSGVMPTAKCYANCHPTRSWWHVPLYLEIFG